MYFMQVKLLGRKCRPVCLSATVEAEHDDDEADYDPFKSKIVRTKVKKGI